MDVTVEDIEELLELIDEATRSGRSRIPRRWCLIDAEDAEEPRIAAETCRAELFVFWATEIGPGNILTRQEISETAEGAEVLAAWAGADKRYLNLRVKAPGDPSVIDGAIDASFPRLIRETLEIRGGGARTRDELLADRRLARSLAAWEALDDRYMVDRNAEWAARMGAALTAKRRAEMRWVVSVQKRA